VTVAIIASVHGRVQGVGFRYTTRQVAQRLGLTGWVRNLPTGSVEVWAQGDPDAVDDLRAWLEYGPPGAMVHTLEVEPVEPEQGMVGFEVRY
jgi:acylphosphatase